MATVREILARKGSTVVTVTPDTSVLDAARLMNERGIGAVVVVEAGALMGIFTERDIMRRVVAVERDPAATPVRAVLSPAVITTQHEAPVEDCAALMTERRIRHLPVEKDNRLVEGRWWTEADRGRKLVSVTTEYQEDLALKLGDRLTFDVAGEALTAEISSFRKVQWDTFQPNFFLVFSPGTLDGLVGTWLTSMKLKPEQRPLLADLVHRFPSVSIFDIDSILAQIRDIMDRASLAVQRDPGERPQRHLRG